MSRASWCYRRLRASARLGTACNPPEMPSQVRAAASKNPGRSVAWAHWRSDRLINTTETAEFRKKGRLR